MTFSMYSEVNKLTGESGVCWACYDGKSQVQQEKRASGIKTVSQLSDESSHLVDSGNFN